MAAAAALQLAFPMAAPGRLVACDPAALHLRLFTEGAATQAVTFLRASDPSISGCALSGVVVFRVEQAGSLARIRQNPLSLPVSTRPESATLGGEWLAHFWWGNWCGARTGILLEATYHGRTVVSRPRVIPACVEPSKASFLSPP